MPPTRCRGSPRRVGCAALARTEVPRSAGPERDRGGARHGRPCSRPAWAARERSTRAFAPGTTPPAARGERRGRHSARRDIGLRVRSGRGCGCGCGRGSAPVRRARAGRTSGAGDAQNTPEARRCRSAATWRLASPPLTVASTRPPTPQVRSVADAAPIRGSRRDVPLHRRRHRHRRARRPGGSGTASSAHQSCRIGHRHVRRALAPQPFRVGPSARPASSPLESPRLEGAAASPSTRPGRRPAAPASSPGLRRGVPDRPAVAPSVVRAERRRALAPLRRGALSSLSSPSRRSLFPAPSTARLGPAAGRPAPTGSVTRSVPRLPCSPPGALAAAREPAASRRWVRPRSCVFRGRRNKMKPSQSPGFGARWR